MAEPTGCGWRAGTALLTLHGWRAINWTHSLSWKYDAETKAMIGDLTERHASNSESKVTLGVSWVFEPSVNYYRVTRRLSWLAPVTREGLLGGFDYYYYLDYRHDDRDALKGKPLVTLKTYPLTGAVFAEGVSKDVTLAAIETTGRGPGSR